MEGQHPLPWSLQLSRGPGGGELLGVKAERTNRVVYSVPPIPGGGCLPDSRLVPQSGLRFPARRCRGLRSEALTKPISPGPWPAPHPPLTAWLGERGSRVRATRQGLLGLRRLLGAQDPGAQTLDFHVARATASQGSTSCREPDPPCTTPLLYTFLLPKALKKASITPTLQKRKRRPREGMSLGEVTQHR